MANEATYAPLMRRGKMNAAQKAAKHAEDIALHSLRAMEMQRSAAWYHDQSVFYLAQGSKREAIHYQDQAARCASYAQFHLTGLIRGEWKSFEAAKIAESRAFN